MKYSRAIALLIMFSMIHDGHSDEPLRTKPLRTWKDDSGTFEVEATLVGVVDGSATMELADGTKVDVPLDRLSGSDRRYIAREARKSSPVRSTTAGNNFGDNKVRDTEQRYGIRWHRTLDGAVSEAGFASRPSSERPIMCFRVLGDLDGFM
ncbi:MAG: SHD1 domain-containing protein [Rubripirellula sp.]